MELEKLLAKKRRKSLCKLVIPVIGEFLIMTTPKPGLEAASEVILSAADIAIFFDIWVLYFDEELDEIKLEILLKEMGMTTLLGSIAAFLTAKLANAFTGEASNFVPVVGWLVEGLIASTITLISGILWINFCETVYRKKVQTSSVSVV
jgi:hypothetical protein